MKAFKKAAVEIAEKIRPFSGYQAAAFLKKLKNFFISFACVKIEHLFRWSFSSGALGKDAVQKFFRPVLLVELAPLFGATGLAYGSSRARLPNALMKKVFSFFNSLVKNEKIIFI